MNWYIITHRRTHRSWTVIAASRIEAFLQIRGEHGFMKPTDVIIDLWS